MRILWSSNAPWCGTGYGTQTATFVPRIAALGHDVAIQANFGLNGAVLEWDGHRVYPAGQEQYGSNDVLAADALHWFRGEPGLLVTLYDVWTYKTKPLEELPLIASWAPVDHSPCPPRVTNYFTQTGATPVAYSRFGEQMFAAAGLTPMYVPHGIDTNVYRPHDQREARKSLGLPQDRFIVGMVSTNKGRTPSRKAFDCAFRAFKALSLEHDDALLYVHSDIRGRSDGLELDILATHYGIDPDHLIFVDSYAYKTGQIDGHDMARYYSSFDVLSFATMGEGFGLPAIEAQACGCPVIVTNFSAQAELCGAGWAVPFQLAYDGFQAADLAIPLDDYMIAAHLEAYEARGDQGLRGKAVEFAQAYDADRVTTEFWKPALDVLADRVSTEPIRL